MTNFPTATATKARAMKFTAPHTAPHTGALHDIISALTGNRPAETNWGPR